MAERQAVYYRAQGFIEAQKAHQQSIRVKRILEKYWESQNPG